jgi:RNA polymerase sigma factor (sigma-70 family)
MDINTVTDQLYRHASGKMIAVLTRIFGTDQLETAEDVVQQAFIDAMRVWRIKGIPANPEAWLFRVAKNKAIDLIRKNKYSVQFDFNDPERQLFTSEYTLSVAMNNFWNDDPVKDDLLRMMFVCCNEDIPQENQITLILKTLCGFTTLEIAKAFLTTEDSISKRLYRTKEILRAQKIRMEIPPAEKLKPRLNAMLNSIYLLFNEGYNSSNSDELIRRDLMNEAILLCRLLTENTNTALPETYALMALFCFQFSRNDSRLDENGDIVLLREQDRSRWNSRLIMEGNEYMDKSAFGDAITAYHLEAAIAYEHASARNFGDTNWQRILELYNLLCKINPSPVTALNRAIVTLQLYGPHAALEELKIMQNNKKMEAYYLYHSLMGEIHSRLDNSQLAIECYRKASDLTGSEKEKKFLARKIASLH